MRLAIVQTRRYAAGVTDERGYDAAREMALAAASTVSNGAAKLVARFIWSRRLADASSAVAISIELPDSDERDVEADNAAAAEREWQQTRLVYWMTEPFPTALNA